MYASIRSYALGGTPIDEFAALVQASFADLIAAQPGFVWYAFLDGGDGTAMTISVFSEPEQAAASRELARRWTQERRAALDVTMTEACSGTIPVSRALPELLEAAPARFARVRRYGLGGADLGEVVWRVVDTRLAERISALDGFVAYFVLGLGDGELVSVSVFRDRDAALASDAVATAFVGEQLVTLGVKRTDAIGGGTIVVTRVTDKLLEPIHA
ncbi:MAG: hypothetical protein ABSG43_02070 [Solirubrobacteraceae bacterium]